MILCLVEVLTCYERAFEDKCSSSSWRPQLFKLTSVLNCYNGSLTLASVTQKSAVELLEEYGCGSLISTARSLTGSLKRSWQVAGSAFSNTVYKLELLTSLKSVVNEVFAMSSLKVLSGKLETLLIQYIYFMSCLPPSHLL
ncbi:hypothetical protein M758_7G105500 [Ceratodon purpureus]|nr:hypothetical protein M758_7G105500 [Ceratodon purpureus]